MTTLRFMKKLLWCLWISSKYSYDANKLKALLRDFAFSDYKWITRAQVQREICALKWKNRDRLFVINVLSDLQETIK